MTALAHIIAAVAFGALCGLCLKLDRLRHQYFRGWKDECANAAFWRARASANEWMAMATEKEGDEV